jgi:putative ATP-dependent endonuclease of the OLD family
VEILAYGGKDALRNTTILSFTRQVVQRMFITFDLDGKDQVQRHLEQVGLVERKDFIPIGLNSAGRRCIEGLVPERVFRAVYGRETDLVCALNETGNERKSARSALKRKLLEEFKVGQEYTEEELRNFALLGKVLSRGSRTRSNGGKWEPTPRSCLCQLPKAGTSFARLPDYE